MHALPNPIFPYTIARDFLLPRSCAALMWLRIAEDAMGQTAAHPKRRERRMAAEPQANSSPALPLSLIELLSTDTDRAYAIALRVTGNSALAEEAVQEAWIRLLRKPPQDQGAEQVRAYLLKAVHGVAVNLTQSIH